ncbi:unnamed protein product [Protopolystoma xenopodis]|uniref:Uncharacterized protein n=1 Tax=Protopolystoma xenopodis TaxID=117903 RepID=A0A448XT11_9PLAT|nr:unnamed protein product [Protopolystoma xenopodis]
MLVSRVRLSLAVRLSINSTPFLNRSWSPVGPETKCFSWFSLLPMLSRSDEARHAGSDQNPASNYSVRRMTR